MRFNLSRPLHVLNTLATCLRVMRHSFGRRHPFSSCVLFCFALVALALTLCPPTRAQEFDTVLDIKQWLAQTEHQGTIAPGTVITTQNWQQYKEFMPPGMQQMFAGSLYWKIPPDARITIDPPRPTPVSKYYLQATEQFGNQT